MGLILHCFLPIICLESVRCDRRISVALPKSHTRSDGAHDLVEIAPQLPHLEPRRGLLRTEERVRRADAATLYYDGVGGWNGREELRDEMKTWMRRMSDHDNMIISRCRCTRKTGAIRIHII